MSNIIEIPEGATVLQAAVETVDCSYCFIYRYKGKVYVQARSKMGNRRDSSVTAHTYRQYGTVSLFNFESNMQKMYEIKLP